MQQSAHTKKRTAAEVFAEDPALAGDAAIALRDTLWFLGKISDNERCQWSAAVNLPTRIMAILKRLDTAAK